MPWTPPADPITSTVITVAYAVANLLTQIRWLRLMTGNADPPGTGYVVVADSTSATSWKTGVGAVTGVLGYTPVNKTGDTMSGTLIVPGLQTGTDGIACGGPISATIYQGGSTGLGTPSVRGLIVGTDGINVGTGGIAASGPVITTAALSAASYSGGSTSGGTISVLGLLVGTNGATFAGPVTVGGNAVITAGNIGSQTVAQAANATQVGFRTPSTGPIPNGIPAADPSGKIDAGWLPAGGGGGGGDAASVTGHVPTATPAPGALPLANASGKLDDWVTPSVAGATVPSGCIALWDGTPTTAPPSGWTFLTSFNGRFVIAATPSGSTTLGATGGGSTHAHATNIAHGHNDTFSMTGTVGAATGSTNQANIVTPNPASSADTHAHGFTPTKSGTVTALANPTNLASDAVNHLPPFVALNYMKKS